METFWLVGLLSEINNEPIYLKDVPASYRLLKRGGIAWVSSEKEIPRYD